MATEQELAQALSPAFGIYPKAFRGNYGNPEDSANLPVDVTRGRTASFLGFGSDLLNIFQSPKPMEVFGDVQYEPKIKVPYDTEHFLKTLPLTPTSRAGQVAGQAASFVPLNPAPLVRAGVAGAKALAPTAARMTEGYLQRQGLMPGVMPEQPSLLGNLTTKPKAEVSPLGFYSAVEQQALNIPRKQGSGESFLNDLAKGQDVKKYEMETMGLDEFLRGKPNVTRQEVQDFIAGNRIDVQEKMLGGNQAPSQDLLSWMNSRNIMTPRNPEGWQELSQKLESYAQQHQKAQGAPETSQRYFTLSEEAGRISEGLDAGGSAAGATRYDKYQLPGGENYREILLTLPAKRLNENEARKILGAKPDAKLSEADISYASRKVVDEYKSSHFDEPNILAHMRVNDRIDADGKKMLLIEEVQSDWHQAGREKGYKTKESLEKWYSQNKLENDPSFADLNSEQRSVIERNRSAGMGGDNAVPDAPFKETWHQLALKRALKEAVDKGYDRIGLTTGKQQAERYDLSKQISKVYYSPPDSKQANKYGTVFKAFDSRGNEIINKSVTPEELPGIVGKEVAQKLLDAESNSMGVKALEGVDLQVGGEGMKKYYDEIYPAFLNKQGKKYGAKVGETQVPTDRSTIDGMPSRYQNKETVRYLDITPEMRKAIKEGQPIASIQNELAKALA